MQLEMPFTAAETRSECGCTRVDRFKHWRQGRVMVSCFTCCAQWDAETGMFQGDVLYPSQRITLPGGQVWHEIGQDPYLTDKYLTNFPCKVPLR